MSNEQHPIPIEPKKDGDQIDTRQPEDWGFIERKVERQRIWQRWIVLFVAVIVLSGFCYFLYKLAIHCFANGHEFIQPLLSASNLVLLVFTFPIAAIITIIWFLMHYIYGPQGNTKESLKAPQLEVLDSVREILGHIKDILPFIKKD